MNKKKLTGESFSALRENFIPLNEREQRAIKGGDYWDDYGYYTTGSGMNIIWVRTSEGCGYYYDDNGIYYESGSYYAFDSASSLGSRYDPFDYACGRPYTRDEYYLFCSRSQWQGGYVEDWGYVDACGNRVPSNIGELTVTFDRSDHQIRIYVRDCCLGTYSAYNNVDSRSKGIWPNGTYSMLDQHSALKHNNSEDTFEGSFGIYGIFRANTFVYSNVTREYMGIHSGRCNNPEHPTYGCIRTTDEAMSKLTELLNYGHTFTSITVQD
ncbi:MAG: hypothetical protein LBR67_05540 [Dysgonamonadaceae bacterium]|jgi:hypothetical protein|nr:hypothetical protein [Dysgonamonadaceae bacterium]